MKIQLIVIFMLIDTTVTRSKTKYTEREVIKNSCDIIACCPNQSNNTKTKLIKNDEDNEEIEELLKYLDCLNVPELSNEELNNYSPVTININCLSEILEIDQTSKTEKQNHHANEQSCIIKSNQLNVENLRSHSKDIKNQNDVIQKFKTKDITEDHFNNLTNEVDCKIDKNNNHTHVIDDKNLSDNKLYPKKRLVGFKSYIEKYISDNIPLTYSDNFLRRIKIIEEACQIIDNYKIDEKTYAYVFEPIHDKELICKLKKLTSKYNKNSEFNKKNFEFFFVEFDKKIFKSINSKEILVNLAVLPDDHRKPFFYLELIKFYKHVSQLPDLLAFGGLFTNKSYRKTVVIMHIINLFIDNIGSIKENSFFILCMICTSFKYIYGSQYDFFRSPHYECECPVGRHDLRNFLWEFNSKKRRRMSFRKISRPNLNATDKKFLKSVLMLYLYQHIIYMKVQNVSLETASLFTIFIERVVNLKECIPCLFNEYLGKI